MCISESRIGDEKPLLFCYPFRELLWAKFFQFVTRSLGHLTQPIKLWNRSRITPRGDGSALDQFIAVDDHVSEKRQQFGGAVFSYREVEEVWRLVDEPSRTVTVNKGLMIKQF